jgi:sulfite exporter TauE/SafE
MQALAPFLALGLFGAAHCAGMCGGFAIAVSAAAGRRRWRLLGHQAAYLVGKALSYAVLGILAARAGELFGRTGALLAPGERSGGAALLFARRIAALACGLALVGAGVAALLPRRPRAAFAPGGLRSRAARALARLAAAVRRLPGAGAAFGSGILNGWLPCGLSFAALILAASSTPLTGAAGMFLFGLATAPVLLALGLGWSGLRPAWRLRLQRAVGPALLLLGILTLVRGLPTGSAPAAALLPDCCQEPGPP